MNNRNPLWREMPAFFKYIERSQSILQKAQLQNDVLVYWPFFDFAASEGKLFNSTNIDRGDDSPWFRNSAFAALLKKLTETGYSFDYISDKQLLDCQVVDKEIVTGGKARYKAIILPETKYLPVETMKKLLGFIENGGKVFFDKHLPASVPGLNNLKEREEEFEHIKNRIDSEKYTGNVIDLL